MNHHTFSLEIKPRSVSLRLDKPTADSFCNNVINILQNEHRCQNVLSYLGACWLYNKLRTKTSAQMRLKVPMEYGILIKKHCQSANRYHELEESALYNIYEQLDKQIKF